MVERVPIAGPDETAGEVVHKLKGRAFACVTELFVCDGARRLVGMVPLAELLAASADAPVRSLARNSFPRVTPDTDQERVATLALRRDVLSVPVVDDTDHLLGVVPPQALLMVLRREHVEDLHRLAGIRRESARARHAIEEPPSRRARDRLPWLLAGLLGSVVATALVARFEEVLAARVVVAFFIPGIVYLADAIGTQTEAIAVRSLSVSDHPLSRLVWGEARAGFLIGLVLAVPVLGGVFIAFHDARLALAVAISVFAAGAVATTLGVGLPWLLKRAGRDPAFGSGPLATVVQDVLSIAIYFAVVKALL
jgi:magnesium transporter